MTNTRHAIRKWFDCPAGGIEVAASSGVGRIGGTPAMHLTLRQPGKSAVSGFIPGDDAYAVALAVAAGDMPAAILADWLEDRGGWDVTAAQLRHPDTKPVE